MAISGMLKKMRSELSDSTVHYTIKLGEADISLNQRIGNTLRINFEGKIRCVRCLTSIKKSFGEGFCYNCFTDSPENSPCILRPELCEGHLGKGRDLQWELDHHVQEHAVYLALSSQVKVGVTRMTQIPTRWIDQGASEAIILAITPHRQLAGQIEVALKELFTDKTSWQKMLKNEVSSADLVSEKWRAADLLPRDLEQYVSDHEITTQIHYPVIQYPEKVSSLNLDKLASIEGTLLGIKGQYLLFDQNRVFNLRSHSGYEVHLE